MTQIVINFPEILSQDFASQHEFLHSVSINLFAYLCLLSSYLAIYAKEMSKFGHFTYLHPHICVISHFIPLPARLFLVSLVHSKPPFLQSRVHTPLCHAVSPGSLAHSKHLLHCSVLILHLYNLEAQYWLKYSY